MTLPLRPSRGGFLRPFGTAVFIRDFLAGEGQKYGTVPIDPAQGAPQSDIHAAYKGALHRAMAGDMVAMDMEEAARNGKPMTPEQVEERQLFYLERIPYKLTRMRYSSFTNYFARLIQLGWVEPSRKTEDSEAQQNWDSARPRVYYHLTEKGKAATMEELSDPIQTIYDYPRQKRSPKNHRYFRPPTARSPRRRRRN